MHAGHVTHAMFWHIECTCARVLAYPFACKFACKHACMSHVCVSVCVPMYEPIQEQTDLWELRTLPVPGCIVYGQFNHSILLSKVRHQALIMQPVQFLGIKTSQHSKHGVLHPWSPKALHAYGTWAPKHMEVENREPKYSTLNSRMLFLGPQIRYLYEKNRKLP